MRSLRTMVAAALAATLAVGTAIAATPSITIETVGGQAVKNGQVAKPLSGDVAVTGRASLEGAATEPGSGGAAAEPLVADAGDSSFVKIGQPALLVGTGFGGVEPYAYAWSVSVGEVEGSTGATASWTTTGVPEGTHTATLTITDAAGATATDTVKVAVYDPNPTTLLDEQELDVAPGTFATGETVEYTFDVPAGTLRIDATAEWVAPTNDYDLFLHDPSGAEAGKSENFPGEPEAAGVADPVPGTWTLVLLKYATVVEPSLHVRVEAVDTADPRPAVDTTGPYAFLTGAAQQLEGSVEGGTAPVTTGWDTDFDGELDMEGASVTTSLPEGRHLVTFKATDAAGFERRETTSVLVGSAERLAASTTALTVIGVADTGINAYHHEFSAALYPDPDVLALTENFTRHPSEYIAGYPANAAALPITLDEGYYPEKDRAAWASVELGKLYWIPGTKIIGAVDANNASASNASSDATPILDDDGHGSGASSVSAGNRYGYCPTCLLFFVEGLDETVATTYPFVDITSHSFGYVGGAPVGPLLGPNEATRDAAERGQITLFAAGNGIGNAFDVPQATWGSDQTGASWNITVGAIRRDNQRAIVGDGIPVDISAWGDGNLPSACRTGTVGQCAFGGTSAATPYTAGVFGTVLTRVREAIGDGRPGQADGVVAEGLAIPGSDALHDGKLTREELRDAVLKTAFPLNQGNEPSTFPYPLTAPYLGPEANVLFEGYGTATPESAERAVDVLLGRALMPDRSFEDEFFALDEAIKDTLYGGYDRNHDGDRDDEGDYVGFGPTEGVTPASVATVEGTMAALRIAADKLGATASVPAATGAGEQTWYLHRTFVAEPGKTPSCSSDDNESTMDTSNTEGDLECFENRVTSVPAAYRPLGMYPATEMLDAPLPAGSTVQATVYVAAENPSIVRPTGVLMATDREIGTGQGALQPVLGTGTGPGSNIAGQPIPAGPGCEALGELCWTKFEIAFETTRPAFTGEQLTFQIQLVGARAWAFGHEGEHASRLTITPAPMPASGLEFGATIDEPADGTTVASGSDIVAGGGYAFPDLGDDPTGAGDHPTTRRVEVSIDDPAFGDPIEATLDEESGTWSAAIGALEDGEHTLHVRARIDTTTSEVASSTFVVGPAARVEWQVVTRNQAPDPAAWRTADGVESWQFSFDTADHGSGQRTIVTRLVSGDLELARSTVRAKFG